MLHSNSGSLFFWKQPVLVVLEGKAYILNSVEADVNVCVQHPQRLLHVLGPCQGKVRALGWQYSVVAQIHPACAALVDQSLPRGPR